MQRIKNCVSNDKYTVVQNANRQENIKFIQKYNLNISKIKKTLLSIKIEDFCHSLQNTKIGYKHEVLYVFCSQNILFDASGKEELTDIYIKFNIIEYANNKRVITISFHKRNKPIDYAFR